MTLIEGKQVVGLIDAFKEILEHRKNLLNIDHKLQGAFSKMGRN